MTSDEESFAPSPRTAGGTKPLVDHVMDGSLSLAKLPLEDCRRVARQLLDRADSNPRAEKIIEDFLKGPIPVARPIGRFVASSKKRNILLRAWISWLRDATSSFRKDRASVDLKEVAARGEWITKQLGKMRSVPAELAEELLDVSIPLAVLVLRLQAGRPAEIALAQIACQLRPRVRSFEERVIRAVMATTGPPRHRALLVQDLELMATGDRLHLVSMMRQVALGEDPEFAEYLFSAIPDRRERSRELSRAIRSGCDPQLAAQVIEALLEQTTPEYQATYLEPLLMLAVDARELPPNLIASIVDIVTTVPPDRAPPGPVSSVLYKVQADLQSRHDASLTQVCEEHETAMEAAQARDRALEHNIRALEELVESVKRKAREPEQQTEHRVRVATLTPICLIHQDILLALRDRPDVRLANFAQTLQGTLIRQGVTPVGSAGETVSFDPSRHEHARWSRPRAETVTVVAPGYVLTHPMLGREDVLARAVVESADSV